MERTEAIDELFDVGWRALESHDPAAFMEWRRRVAEVLGPDHIYAQLFQDREDTNSPLTGPDIHSASTAQGTAKNKRVA